MINLRRRTKKILLIVSVIAVPLLIGRALLPWAIKAYVNKTLDAAPGYSGHIGDIDVNLWRGAYQIEDVAIDKLDLATPVPLFYARTVDLSVYWRQLLHGALVGNIAFEEPQVNFVDRGKGKTPQTGGEVNWLETIKQLFPIRIDYIEIKNGLLQFHQFESEPEVHVQISGINGRIENLTNTEEISKSLFAQFDFTGSAMGRTPLLLSGAIDPYAVRPTFDLNGELHDFDLRLLNNFLKQYARVDVQQGRFDLVIEVSADMGRLNGYAKPFFKDLDVFDWNRDLHSATGGILHATWEGIVGAGAELFKNHPKDQLATRVSIEGDIEKPDTPILPIIGNVLKNAFIKALVPQLEHSVKLSGKSG